MIDLATAVRVLTTEQAAVFLGISTDYLGRLINDNPIYRKYFWNVGTGKKAVWRTSLLLITLMQLELVGLAVPGENIIQSFISSLKEAA